MGPERELRPHEEVVERTLEWVAVAFLTLNLPLSTARAVRHPQAYAGPFAAVVLAALWLLTAYAVVRRSGGRSALVPLRAAVAVGVVALVLHPVAAGEAPVDYPPLLHVLGATAAVSPVLGVRFSAGLIPAYAAYVAFLRTPVLGVGHAIAEASLLAVSALLATVSVGLLRRANRSVLDAVRALTAASESRLRARRRAYEREHWNALVHDKVIGALQLAAHGEGTAPPQAGARELAEQSIAAFRGERPRADVTVPEALAAHARLLGLEVLPDVDGDVPDPEVRAALTEAAKEALTNVSRHAGTRRARVHGRLDARGAVLVVSDTGRGFDTARRPAGRGITTSLHGRMSAVGGSARVVSRPGAGTTVRLEWTAPADGAPDGPDAEWQLHAFAPAMLLGLLCLGLNIVIGAQQWRLDRWPVATGAGIAAILGITAAAAWLRPTDRRWPRVLLAATVTAGLLTVDIPAGAGTDWRYWYLGALTPAVGAIAFRFRRWAGPATAAALTLTVCVVDAAVGRSWWASLGGPVPVLFAVAIAGQGIRASMDRAWQRVTEAEQERVRVRLASAIEEERSREAAARVAALADTVGPWLARIAAGEPTSARDRMRLALLESSVRDHLAGPDLLDASLVQALHESRARGVRTVVVHGTTGRDATADGPHVSPQVRHGYRRVFTELLRAADPGDRVRAVWGAPTPGTCGTISVVLGGRDRDGAGAELLAAVVGSLPPRHRPVVTRDETCLLVEFPG